ncbi:cystathionine gamma-synthase [Anaerobacillus alkalilacustris]|uniref:cysteine-S-conjugate beta-lyase n=1 Tax=Anaerobacillus alkalilacustris TaxID=393763 RepID=A0A1S2LQQ3_9BACI|nr:cystathionine beta-lyase [Anaerobacillus alkalilacustris]OIJ14838.1 cystathionine gamma-synthase [Anaerobacillus alkalilacustris]
MSENYHIHTQLLHNDHKVCPSTGAVSVPIHHSSTFHQNSFDEFGIYEYARGSNPTRKALEDVIAQLEGGTRGFAFSSGMAAISTAFMLLSEGDHVLITEDVYGGTYRFVTEVLPRFGIEHTFVDMTNEVEVAEKVQPNTKLIYIETPSNPTLKITDIRAMVKLAKKHNCLTFCDNTFLTPVFQRPLELGVDIVLHSATKFLGGHSDVVAGLAVVKDEELGKRLAFLQNSFGAILGVQDSWLVLRGLKTLQVRMNASTLAAAKLAEWLNGRQEVEKVYYPGLPQHPGKEIQEQQSTSHGAVLSFEFSSKENAKAFVENVKLPVFAVSLGAVETILSYPTTMSHGSMPKEEREKRGISDGLLRLSVGLEDVDDLISDFTQALETIESSLVKK